MKKTYKAWALIKDGKITDMFAGNLEIFKTKNAAFCRQCAEETIHRCTITIDAKKKRKVKK